jgi:hypothetical protein
MCLHALWLTRTQLSWEHNRTRYLDVVGSLIGEPAQTSTTEPAGDPAGSNGPGPGPVQHDREGSHGH